jgi:hypothetical protein
MQPQEAWEAVEPLSKLGIALGELDVKIEIPQPIELLGIPAEVLLQFSICFTGILQKLFTIATLVLKK